MRKNLIILLFAALMILISACSEGTNQNAAPNPSPSDEEPQAPKTQAPADTSAPAEPPNPDDMPYHFAEFTGIIDQSSIELKIQGEHKAFRWDDEDGEQELQEKDIVQVRYVENENGQLLIDDLIVLPQEKELEVFVEGEINKRKADLALSDLSYVMYVLDRFKLVSEEPSRDQLFSEYDDSFFVRIIKLDNEADIEQLKQNSEQALQQTGDLIKEDPTALHDDFFHDAHYYYIGTMGPKENASGSYIHLVKSIDEQLFKFEFHIPLKEAQEGIVPNFWAMIKSIQGSN